MSDSNPVELHIPCPDEADCGSSDGATLYDDDRIHCFVCGKNFKADGTQYRSSKREHKVSSEELQSLIDTSEVKAIQSRKLTQATCKHWDYRIRVDPKTNEPQHIAIYKDEHGVPVGAKVRRPDKSFFQVGELPPLYGMQFLGNGGRKVIVCEGEIDCLTVSQMWGNKFPVVSVPKGINNARKDVSAALDKLIKFDEVVLCFDMDEPGRKGAVEVAKLLPPGKAHIVSLSRKDPNEMLVEGEGEALINSLLHPAPYRPDGIVSGAALKERAKTGVGWGCKFGMPFLDELQWGWRDGEVIVNGAGVGMGKTDLELQVAAHIEMVERLPIAIFNYEASPERTLIGIAGKWAQKRFTDMDGLGVTWTEEERDAALDAVTDEDRLFINDHQGAVDWPSVKDRIRFLVHAKGVKRAFIDPVAALVASEDDDRKALDALFADAKQFAEEMRIGLWFNSHLARPKDGKSHEEGGRVTMANFRGSGAITMWASLVLGMERNQQAEDIAERRTTILRSLKVREAGEKTGSTGSFIFNTVNGMVEPTEPLLGKDAMAEPPKATPEDLALAATL